jgi:hypothetical protein
MIQNKMATEDFYAALDAGIRFAVRVLHAAGFDTCQSCQGGSGHPYHEPTVDMAAGGHDSHGFGALAALNAYGLPVADLSLVWPIANGLPYEKLWRITFTKPFADRADERPIFIFGYENEPT